MEIQANAKINLSLDVTGRRPDGYHLVRMVMQSISLHDTLYLERTACEGIGLTVEGNDSIPCGPENLVWRAAEAMLARCRSTGGVRIRLVKRIPSAAGLAGGSTGNSASCSRIASTWLMWSCVPQTARGWLTLTSTNTRLAFSIMAGL